MKRADLFTVKEVAKYLKLHEITVYRMLKNKRIPAIRVGGQWRFESDAIKAWLDSSNPKAPSKRGPHLRSSAHIPKYLYKYFWDTEPEKISPAKNSTYILERLLEYADRDGIEWMKKSFTKEEIENTLRTSNRLTSRSANYWRLFLKIPREEIACLRRPSQGPQERIWRH